MKYTDTNLKKSKIQYTIKKMMVCCTIKKIQNLTMKKSKKHRKNHAVNGVIYQMEQQLLLSFSSFRASTLTVGSVMQAICNRNFDFKISSCWRRHLHSFCNRMNNQVHSKRTKMINLQCNISITALLPFVAVCRQRYLMG